MRRNVRSVILAACVAVSAVLQGTAVQMEDVFADTGSENIKAASVRVDYGVSSVVTADGSLYLWGSYSYGPQDAYVADKSVPHKVMDGVKQADVGDGFYGVIKTDGNLYMWGENNYGQLGDGTGQDRALPVKILDNVKSVELGYGNGYGCTGAVTTDGSFYMWGHQDEGIGDGTAKSMLPVKIMDNAALASLGHMHSGVLSKNGELHLWGSNSFLQMGVDAQAAGAFEPQKMMNHITSVSLGGFHTAAITKDGSLYVWGANEHGQAGNGTVSRYVEEPVKVMDNVAQASLSEYGSAAVTKDGSLYVWGANEHGQAGNGTKTDCLTPVKILDNAASVSISSTHGAAITKDGSLYMWGRNLFGELGDGTKKESLVPKKIELGSASIKLAETSPEAPGQQEMKIIYKIYTKDNAHYAVNKDADGSCAYYRTVNRNTDSITIPASVVLEGKQYKVTSVMDGAFENFKNLKSVKIGRNVTQIGKRAFFGCASLKNIAIQSENLKSAGKESLSGIHKKAVIKVPKAKLSAYKKLLKEKGQGAGVKIKGV